MIKDAADLFALEGARAEEILKGLKEDAKDALDLVLLEAPAGSARERYRHARERVFPLLVRLEDEGERGAALDDAAGSLGLGKRDLRKAFGEYAEQTRQVQGAAEHDDEPEDEPLAPEPGSERHGRAMGLLTDPDILERAAQTMEGLGHVGEHVPKKLAFVCGISARAGHPIQPSTHAESSTGKNYLWDTALSLFPPEMVIKRSAVSDKALFRTEADLRGAILYLQEVAGSEGADFTIRILQSAQSLEYEATEKMPDGSFRTVVHRKEGPTVVVQTTTKLRLFHENDTRVFPIYLDESAEQTGRIVGHALLRAETGGVSQEEREDMVAMWHDAVRLLEPAEVIVPYARRIEVPSHRVRVRRDVNRLLDVIRVLAWLHQHVRDRDEQGRVLATEDDFRVALELVSDSLGRAWRSLTPVEEALMDAARALPEARRRNGFHRADLGVEGYDKRRTQDALKALTDTGYLECDFRKGPRGYRYSLSRDPENRGLGISLRTPGDGREDAPNEPDAVTKEEDDDEDSSHPTDEEGEARASARDKHRAVGSALSTDEEPTARSRGDEPEYSPAGEVLREVTWPEDCLEELSALGWFRAETAFEVQEFPEGYLLDKDPVAYRLRHKVGIFQGYGWVPYAYDGPTVLVVAAEDVLELRANYKEEEALRLAGGWPSTPQEMGARLGRVIPLLQAEPHPFLDLGLADWYPQAGVPFPRDPEKLCRPAYLHAEKWKREGSDEELWALVALREGWSPPDRAIEFAVWFRATNQSLTIESSDEDDFQF